MLLTLFNIVYVLVAMSMIILILLQRGSGAQAGSGFGGGASGTVFGARGAATFLSRSTGMLAGLFFLLSLGMAWYLGHAGGASSRPADDLGVMSGLETPAAPKATAPAGGSAAPVTVPVAAPNGDVPTAPASPAPAAASTANSDVPKAAPVAAPAATPPPATPASTTKPTTKPADKNKH